MGAGGTGKTTIILELILKVFVIYFPPQDEEDRYFILTFSHAQGAAISNDNFRAQTAHKSHYFFLPGHKPHKSHYVLV